MKYILIYITHSYTHTQMVMEKSERKIHRRGSLMERGTGRGAHQESKVKCKHKCICALHIHTIFFEGGKEVEALSPEDFHCLCDLRSKMTYEE